MSRHSDRHLHDLAADQTSRVKVGRAQHGDRDSTGEMLSNPVSDVKIQKNATVVAARMHARRRMKTGRPRFIRLGMSQYSLSPRDARVNPPGPTRVRPWIDAMTCPAPVGDPPLGRRLLRIDRNRDQVAGANQTHRTDGSF
jgi:hypothetical protein